MATFRGVVHRRDLEGGIWELVCDDGARLQLDGGDSGLLRDGLRVQVDGELDDDAMGIGMTGPVLVVRSYRKG